MMFLNRHEAGRLIAEKLADKRYVKPIVFALPRGGVPVAFEIAKSLKAPIDVLVTRKIGAPFQEELGVGAICEDGEPFWNWSMLARLNLTTDDMEPTVKKERDRIRRQVEIFREGRPLSTATGRTAIIVDDGLATGATMMAAIQYLKSKGPASVVATFPVGAAPAIRRLQDKADEVVVLHVPDDFETVGQWYDDFSQVSDHEVISSLRFFK